MWLSYDHLCNIPEISLTNDFYEISVPVTLPSRCGIYLQYPKYTYLQYLKDIADQPPSHHKRMCAVIIESGKKSPSGNH